VPRIFPFLSTFALFCGLTNAQVGQFEGKPIVDILFSGVQPLDPADLAKVQPLKIGQPLRMSDVAHAIDGLFATGRFEDIVVEGEASGDGVAIRFVTKNTWFVGGVTVQGKVVEPPNRGQIASTAQLVLGMPFQDDDVTHAVVHATTELRRALEPAISDVRDAGRVVGELELADASELGVDVTLAPPDAPPEA